MKDMQKLVDMLATKTDTRFRPASQEDLSELRALGVPQSVMDFYARYEPEQYTEGKIRLWTIGDLVVENCGAVPGAEISPLGYVVFASTFCGDAYCFNLNGLSERHDEPPIVLISHEVVEEGISAVEAARLAKPIADNLYEFLQKFVRDEIDTDCIY